MDSNSIQNLTTNPELVSGLVEVISSLIYAVATILAAVATVFAALVVIFGIKSWRREFRGKRQIELAEDVLALFYETRDSIIAIRNSFSHEGEGSTRKPTKNETEQEKKAKDMAYIVWERYDKRQSVFNKLHSMRYRFMVQIGNKEAEPFEQIQKIVSDIFIAASMLSELWAERSLPYKSEKKDLHEEIKKYEAIIWWQGSENEIDTRVNKVVADIEKTCKIIIMQK